MTRRQRVPAWVLGVVLLAGLASSLAQTESQPSLATPAPTGAAGSAVTALDTLPVKGRAPRTGYARAQFGSGWSDPDRNGCDTRNDTLRRDLLDVTARVGTQGCVILSGTLRDPYSDRIVNFRKEQADRVQIDHVVSLSNAWQTGAQQWDRARRTAFANDPLEVLAVEGSVNGAKSDSDVASWLPPHKPYRCPFVARQIAIKVRWGLWVTPPEKAMMQRVLSSCPAQPLPA